MDLSKINKFEDFTFAQWVALAKNIGKVKDIKAVLKGDMEIVLQKVIKKLFDIHGRCIPKDIKGRVHDADFNFYLEQPSFLQKDLVKPISRLHEHANVDTGISPKALQEETRHLIKLIADNPATANLLKGVCLPIICPQYDSKDYKSCLRRYLVPIKNSYENAFKRSFYPEPAVELWDHGGTRADRLLELVNVKSIIGLYFPNALQGFSADASREQIAKLPEGFILSGMDILMAMIMYPDVLASDDKSPDLCMAALSYGMDQSACFQINDLSMYFNSIGLDRPSPGCSSGLFFTG